MCITSDPESKFQSVSLYNRTFSNYRLFSDKSTKWHKNNLGENARSRCTYHICVTSFPEFQIALPFALKPSSMCLQDTRLSKNGNTTDLRMALNNSLSNVYTKYLPHEAQRFVYFSLRPAVSKIQGCQSRKYPRPGDLSMTLNTPSPKVPCIH